MLTNIFRHFLGLFSFSLHTVNTFFWFVPITLFSTFKFLLPIDFIKDLCNRALNAFASSWIFVNNIIIGATKRIDWDITLPKGLSKKSWYLVISNHQTWTDILVLQKIFNGKIPFLKFFLKQELIWVPVLGLAWWALDFPFMKRYKPSYLKKHPEKKGKDFETTKEACEKFKRIPISVMNFVEGTRFTEEKKEKQNSPYNHLLKPKSGGVGFVFAAMGQQFEHVLNVTIHYPQGSQSFWDFMCGKVTKIKVHVEDQAMDPSLVKASELTDEHKKSVRKWINRTWEDKDKLLANWKVEEKN